MTSELEVSIEKTISAPIKSVFEAWLSADALKEFIRPAPEMEVPKVECDPRVGGQFLIVMKVGGNELPHHGKYLSIQKYDEIKFTWLSNHVREDSVVTLRFSEITENETKIHLHHIGFPSQGSKDDHEGGWGRILDTLGLFSRS